jgi:hypothetical protein
VDGERVVPPVGKKFKLNVGDDNVDVTSTEIVSFPDPVLNIVDLRPVSFIYASIACIPVKFICQPIKFRVLPIARLDHPIKVAFVFAVEKFLATLNMFWPPLPSVTFDISQVPRLQSNALVVMAGLDAFKKF